MGNQDDLPRAISTLDIKQTADGFLANRNSELINSVLQLISKISGKAKEFIQELIDTITDKTFRDKIMNAFAEHIKAHPRETAFFIVGIVLIMSPLAMVGFGALGPVAGSAAAAWQSSLGAAVLAGSAFAVLQRWGMVYSIPIVIAGGALVGAAAVGVALKQPGVQNAINQTVNGAQFAGGEVDKWAKGEYGTPVANAVNHSQGEVGKWARGDYGSPVANWWRGDYGNPVSQWFGGR